MSQNENIVSYVSTWTSVKLADGKQLIRVWYVFGTCLVRVWYVFGTCLVRVWYFDLRDFDIKLLALIEKS